MLSTPATVCVFPGWTDSHTALAELLDALERALWRGERSGERVPPASVLRALREAYARDAGAAGGGAAVTLPLEGARRALAACGAEVGFWQLAGEMHRQVALVRGAGGARGGGGGPGAGGRA